MFLGEQALTLDEKGRLVLPAKFRTFITDPEDLKGFFIVADPRRIDRCLRLYTRSGYLVQSGQIKAAAEKAEDPVLFLRIYAAHSEFAPMDTQSRFLVPQKLVDYAGLGRDVVMVGVNDWLEIWDRAELRAQSEGAREKLLPLMTEALRPKLK
ncbi:MAG TPA: hypothetical protein VK661_03425 [Planctomycetota bacterium]|jgi:transcriptional regulator MraZ|nr:hypothetical protein [Planctomycetota bacterium]